MEAVTEIVRVLELANIDFGAEAIPEHGRQQVWHNSSNIFSTIVNRDKDGYVTLARSFHALERPIYDTLNNGISTEKLSNIILQN